ncbi:29044_t:CDS:1, partial [Gigaspora margarita]
MTSSLCKLNETMTIRITRFSDFSDHGSGDPHDNIPPVPSS